MSLRIKTYSRAMPPYVDESEDHHGVRLKFLINETFHFLPNDKLLEDIITDICVYDAVKILLRHKRNRVAGGRGVD